MPAPQVRAAITAVRKTGVRVDVKVTWERGDVDKFVKVGVPACGAGRRDGGAQGRAAGLAAAAAGAAGETAQWLVTWPG